MKDRVSHRGKTDFLTERELRFASLSARICGLSSGVCQSRLQNDGRLHRPLAVEADVVDHHRASPRSARGLVEGLVEENLLTSRLARCRPYQKSSPACPMRPFSSPSQCGSASPCSSSAPFGRP